MQRILIALAVAMVTGGAIAAGMDDDTARLGASDYEKTSPATRFTTPAGSAELDNGMIVKWGQATIAALTSSTAVTFTTAFPSNILSVEVAVEGGALSGASATVSGVSKTEFTINVQCLALAGPIVCTGATTVRWSARGY